MAGASWVKWSLESSQQRHSKDIFRRTQFSLNQRQSTLLSFAILLTVLNLLGFFMAIQDLPEFRWTRDMQRRRRGLGRPLVENKFIFYQRNSRLYRSVRYTNRSKIAFRLNVQWHLSVPKWEYQKFSCRRPRLVDDTELYHLTLLFCRGLQRNVQRITTHVHSHHDFCSLNLLFGDVLVAVIASWFA